MVNFLVMKTNCIKESSRSQTYENQSNPWFGLCCRLDPGKKSVCLGLSSFLVIAVLHTVLRFVWASAKFGACTVVSVNGTLVEAKMCTFTLESTDFIFNKCPIYTHDSASANLALVETKRITVQVLSFSLFFKCQDSLCRSSNF